MSGADVQELGMFLYVSVEDRVPKDHPIRKFRMLADTIFGELDEVFESRHLPDGRMSTPPELLLRASMLQVIYSVPADGTLLEAWASRRGFRPILASAMQLGTGG